ncbi:MAG: gliding motility-associated C-terminal domain-containing protein [Bacteroidetes bacterium]|nr:gliding motility-associated C-terminal domain-containing protein [Bacteroidota bacterium]
MKKITLQLWIWLIALTASGQYLPNPSFEGPFPNPNNPPSGYVNCSGSPDTQPFCWDVPTPPSDGSSYLGIAWLPSWIERVWTQLETPLSPDTCYKFEIDLAYFHVINYYGNQQETFPMKIRIYASTYYCSEGTLLWESPYIDNFEWETFEFTLQPEAEINNMLFRSYYDQSMPAEIGYLLADNIRITPPPELDLGNDTTICLSDSMLVAVPASDFDEFLWSNGSTDTAIYVSEPGTYWVQAMFGECTVTDSVHVSVSPEFDLGNDTTLCIGDTLELSPGDFAQYLWFNGTTDSTLSLYQPGDYLVWVMITDSLGCSAIDSLHLSIINDSTTASLGNDTTICPGSYYSLYPGVYEGYIWNNGSTDSILIVNEAGLYWVTVFGDCGSGSDTISIETFPPIALDLGPDTTICEEVTLTLDAGPGFESYFWQDSTTNQTCTINGTGIYWVMVTDDKGCSAIDSIEVGYSPALSINLGADTTICMGDDFYLSPGNGFASYLWQDGSNEASILVNNPGTYWVYVTDPNGCSGGDTIVIGMKPSPNVSLGNDTTICVGQTLLLEPEGQYTSYLWQDNSTLPFYTVSTSGLYSVTVANNFNCTASAEIYVDVSAPQIDLGPDTIVCEGDELILDAGSGYLSYLWQDSTAFQTCLVDTSRLYKVIVSDMFGCSGADSVWIDWIPLPVADLGEDNNLCQGDTILLSSVKGPYEYFWNGELGWPWMEVSKPGWYHLEVSNQCGNATDEVLVEEYPNPYVDLGENKILTVGQVLELDAGSGYDTYLWQDGSTGQYYQLALGELDPGDPYYFVEVSLGPCIASDTVKVMLFELKIPRVITPNADQKNDLFMPDPETWQGIHSHHMEVYNRWGEKVWESDHFEDGWDGKRNGQLVADGTYYWILEVHYGDENMVQILKGSLTILGAD